MNKIHIVKYYGDYYDVSIFATHDKALAERYVKRFNSILNKWKDYYSRFETDLGFKCISDEHIKYRWHCLQEITKCYIDEIELR